MHLGGLYAIAVDELLIEVIWLVVMIGVRLLGETSLLPVDFHGVAVNAKRPARLQDLGLRVQLGQLQTLEFLADEFALGLICDLAAVGIVDDLRLELLVRLAVVTRYTEHRVVTAQPVARRYHPGVAVANLNHHFCIRSFHAIPLTRVAAAVIALWEHCILAQGNDHVKPIAHCLEADACHLKTLDVGKSELHF